MTIIDVSLDTEFITNRLDSGGLVSIGIDTGTSSYYAVNADMDVRALFERPWMIENVWKHLPVDGTDRLDRNDGSVKPYRVIRDEIGEFFRALAPDDASDDRHQTMWVKYGAQDVVRLHGLWDHDWSAIPPCVPRFADDLARIKRRAERSDEGVKLLASSPVCDESMLHHALWDAVHQLAEIRHLLDGGVDA